jgi:protein-glutamine gamma-glutamyltransferase
MNEWMPQRSLRSAHDGALCAAVFAATALVLLGGELPMPMWLLVLAPPLSFWLSQRGQSLPAWSTWVAILAGVGLAGQSLWVGGADNAVFALGMLLLALLVGRTLTRTTLAHDLQALVVALMLVLAGSVLNVGMSFFVCLVAFAVCAVWALSTRQLLVGAESAQLHHAGERNDVVDRSFFAASSLVSVVVLGFSVALFLIFPRIGIAELSHFFQRGSKLATSVRLGGLSFSMGGGSEVVARVDGIPIDAFEDGLYLRAIVYDELDGSSFRQSAPTLVDTGADERTALPLAVGRKVPNYEVQLFPIAGDLVLTLGPTIGVRVLQGGTTNPNLPLWYRGIDRHSDLRFDLPAASPIRYQVTGQVATLEAQPGPPPKAPLSDLDRQRYVAVPEAQRAALDAVVMELAPAATPTTIVDELRAALLRFRYQRDGGGVGNNAVIDFLRVGRAGNCELFAAGFAMLLRSRGVPARVVGGFQGGVLDETTGTVVFQARHAHAWVEWYDERGWHLDDATPVATASPETLSGFAQWLEGLRRQWTDRVVDYQLEDQQSAMMTLRRRLQGVPWRAAGVTIVTGMALLALVWWWRQRVRGDHRRHEQQLVAALMAAHAHVDVPLPKASTWREALHHSALPKEVLDVLRAATDAVERLRFGDTSPSSAELAGHLRSLRALRRPQPHA